MKKKKHLCHVTHTRHMSRSRGAKSSAWRSEVDRRKVWFYLFLFHSLDKLKKKNLPFDSEMRKKKKFAFFTTHTYTDAALYVHKFVNI